VFRFTGVLLSGRTVYVLYAVRLFFGQINDEYSMILLLTFSAEFSGGPGADVIFMIDGSGSLEASEFQTMKHFVTDVVSSFDIGLNKTRVGLINFRSASLPIHHTGCPKYKPYIVSSICL